ncbi:unnamed protein product [Urochloa decumbens]|uniref:Uncharacterized protein n=1 Tax=Urochloa decumbens TaxID=240449 RepID=A0ABC9BYI2_9POAL
MDRPAPAAEIGALAAAARRRLAHHVVGSCRRLAHHVVGSCMKVSKLSTATFLFRFNDQWQRNDARQARELHIGHVTLRLLQWKRQVGAMASLSNFNYRVRLCIEGVPSHLRHAEAVSSLFKAPAFIDKAVCPMEKPIEEECLRLWLWTSDPDDIATTGTLQVQEPVTLSEEQYTGHWPELGLKIEDIGIVGAAQTMNYDVLIHVDRVLDYTPPSNSSTYREIDSSVSGHPDVEMEESWPVCHPHTWRLGEPDGGCRGSEQRRVSVYDRLGDCNRDRSPPRGGGAGGAGGLGLRQPPPSGRYDLGRMKPAAQFDQGNYSYHPSGQYRGRRLPIHQANWKWQIKHDGRLQPIQSDPAKMMQADDALMVPPLPDISRRPHDPMVDEANRMQVPGVLEITKNNLPVVEATLIAPASHTAEEKEKGSEDASLSATGAQPNGDMHPVDVTEMDKMDVNFNKPAQPALRNEKTPDNIDHLSSPILGSAVGLSEMLLASPNSEGPMIARLFDLNQEWEGVNDCNIAVDVPNTEETIPLQEPCVERPALADAAGRLNSGATEGAAHRSASRGIARLAVPLRKSLLCPPVLKNKSVKAKKQVAPEKAPSNSSRKIQKETGTSVAMTLDEQATKMLMKTTGILVGDGQLSEEAQQRFGNQFVTQMIEDKVVDLRVAFGLPEHGQADRLSALVGEEDSDDV